MKALKNFLIWSGAIWWILFASIGGYFWLGGFLYAKRAPLYDALLCAGEKMPPHQPLGGSGLYLPPSCVRGIYQFRGTSADVATVNSDWKYLGVVLELPEDGEAEKMLTFWTARGANINIQGSMSGATLVEMAASLGNVDSVEMLIKHGARTDIRDKAGLTPLEALRQNSEKQGKKPNEEIVKLLGG